MESRFFPSVTRFRHSRRQLSAVSARFHRQENRFLSANEEVRLLMPHGSLYFKNVLISIRYHDQLLYGCSQPDCMTPSCLSYRKRKATGPFRPYTVLTARALATTLASQDHAEKGLCIHLSIKDVRRDMPSSSHHRDIDHLAKDHNASGMISTSDKGEDKECVIDDIPGERGKPRVNTVKLEEGEKDYKSFAQNIFDTKPMRLLTLAEPSPDMPPKSEMTLSVIKSTALLRNNNITSKDINEGNQDRTNTQSIAHNQDSEKDRSSRPEMQRLACQTIHADDFRILYADLPMINQDPQTDQFVVSDTDHVLAYFSFFSLCKLFRGARVVSDTVDTNELRRLREIFNRPIGSSNPCQAYSRKTTWYIRFICRSICYICDTPDALLRSFVEWKENGTRFSIARSHSLEIIAHVFCRFLDREDFDVLLSNPWSSLDFINRPRFDPATLKGASLRHASGSQGGRNRGRKYFPFVNQILSDMEAAHIAKIALAALVSHIGYLPDEALRLIVRIRDEGLEVPPIKPSSANLDKYDLLMDTLDKFENEAAISLATRLAKVIGFRRWEEIRTPQALQSAEQLAKAKHLSHFMTLLVRNLADCEGLPVLVATDASPPSLRGGTEFQGGDRRVFAGQNKHDQWKHIVIEWMRTVIIKEWDGKAEVPRSSAIGGALELLRHMCKLHTPKRH